MRTWPVPLVSLNWMQHFVAQAFICSKMRALSATGADSMKLTVRRRGVGPQYLAVRTAMRSGSETRSAPHSPVWAVGPIAGAFTGLISMAVLAAAASSDFGSVFGVQRAGPPLSFWLSWL